MKVTIISVTKLPDTINAWGFGGAINKVKYLMSNGDVWIAGTAHYRHLPSKRYLQMRRNNPEWCGGMINDLDIIRTTSAEKYIGKYYLNH